METEFLKLDDKATMGWWASLRAVTEVNAWWPRQWLEPGAEPSFFRWRQHGTPQRLADAADRSGGV